MDFEALVVNTDQKKFGVVQRWKEEVRKHDGGQAWVARIGWLHRALCGKAVTTGYGTV